MVQTPKQTSGSVGFLFVVHVLGSNEQEASFTAERNLPAQGSPFSSVVRSRSTWVPKVCERTWERPVSLRFCWEQNPSSFYVPQSTATLTGGSCLLARMGCVSLLECKIKQHQGVTTQYPSFVSHTGHTQGPPEYVQENPECHECSWGLRHAEQVLNPWCLIQPWAGRP